MDLVVDIPQSVSDQAVLQLLVAECWLLAGPVHIVWNSCHVLHSSSDLCFRLPELDSRGGDVYCLQTRCAYFVDRSGFDVGGQPGEDGCLPRWCLSDASGEDVAHVDGIYGGDWDF